MKIRKVLEHIHGGKDLQNLSLCIFVGTKSNRWNYRQTDTTLTQGNFSSISNILTFLHDTFFSALRTITIREGNSCFKKKSTSNKLQKILTQGSEEFNFWLWFWILWEENVAFLHSLGLVDGLPGSKFWGLKNLFFRHPPPLHPSHSKIYKKSLKK